MENYSGVEIAIIGMSGQFPGADDVNQFWENLKNGVESISFFTDDELINEGEELNFIKNPSYVKANANIENKEFFDAAFFGYTPSEARLMDPQMRLFHENCWKALEDAGCDVTTNDQKIGLFAGASSNINWLSYSLLSNMNNEVNSFNAFQLRDTTFLCSRISYLMNLQGPSINVNTACSTSLVAIQRACMSLLLRECKMALAGGVTIKNYSKKGYIHEPGMIDSSDGHCRTFDSEADGTVGGEGVGVVVLKRLKDAISDGDNIHAIIRGSGVNNDGSNKIAYTAPSVDGQSQAILKAISMSKIEPESISYLEAHGTATKLGDPIEVEALINSFGKSEEKYCAIGSVKTNVGHLDIAAGVAGFIKTVMSLKNKQIPASLHFKNPNQKINFEGSPFFVNTELKEWKNDKYPLRAGVSSFGIGGTNAHIILEEAPIRKCSSESRKYQLLNFSGKTPSALERNIENFKNHLKISNTVLPDMAYTLQAGRASLGYRKTIVCTNREEAINQLDFLKFDSKKKAVSENVKPQVVFMFSGQGSQYLNMCYDLYQSEIIFKNELDKCFEIVKKLSGKDLKSILYANPETNSSDKINETEYTQPLLFIVEYSLAQLIMHWGIKPDIMIGHSIGEYVAACISGVFSLEDSLKIVIKRGELMQSVDTGSMLSISISEKQLSTYLEKSKDFSLAAVNSTDLCVISGEHKSIENFKAFIENEGFDSKIIKTSHAFHSHMMDKILTDFENVVNTVEINPIQIPFISNITAKKVTDHEISKPQYWVSHLRETVRFSDGVGSIMSNKKTVFIEVGPGKVLSSLVKSNQSRTQEHAVINLTRHSGEGVDDQKHLLTSVGFIWENGFETNWKNFYTDEQRLKISLPTYSFDKIEYPVIVDAFKMITKRSLASIQEANSWFYTPSWKKSKLIKSPVLKTGCINLIFIDDAGVGDQLLSKFSAHNEQVVCVSISNEFSKVSDGAYLLNPAQEDDYKKLITNLVKDGKLPSRVIYNWSISENTSKEQAGYNHFDNLLYVVNGLHDKSDIYNTEIIVITNDLHQIIGDEVCDPSKSIQLGLLKVIAQEYSGATTNHIDISLNKEFGDQDTQVLFEEIMNKETGKTVSLRNSQRWLQIFDPVEVDKQTTLKSFREGGIYLITGGLGNLGYSITKYILTEYKAKVILTGRTALPLKHEWKSKANVTDRDLNKIKRLQELDSLSGEVLYKQCDISEITEFSLLIDEIENTHGHIHGVIHTAGVTSGDSIDLIGQLSKESIAKQFSAKIDGLKVLEQSLKDRNLDFCLVTSSISSVLGGLGFAAYASANGFMDYFIHSKRQIGELKNWISVNFDGLDFDEHSENNSYLNIHEIIKVIEQSLELKDLTQIIISKTNLQLRLDNWIRRKNNSEELNGESIDSNLAEDKKLKLDNVSLNTIESALLNLWENFFGKSIEIEDNFFEIGGDSLKALTMLRRIHKTFNVELSIKEFFDCGSIKIISDLISSKKIGEQDQAGSKYTSIERANKSVYYHLSSVQRRLYFLYEFANSSLAYNLPQIVKLEGELNKQHLSEVFQQLLLRHESLHTSFKLIQGVPMQKIDEEFDFEITHFNSKESEVTNVINNFIKPFDLEKAPLLRVGLIQLSLNEHMLMVDMHHIITDGVSQGLLITDFMKLYNNEVLPTLHLHYKDYAEWQQSEEQKTRVSTQKEFWVKKFYQETSALNLPTDFIRPLVSSNRGESINIELSEEQSFGLKALAEQERVTNFMVLLSIYNIFLAKLGNQDDVVVGSPVAGRQHADFENVIGMFVNTLPIRNFPKGEMTFREFLDDVKSNTIACFDNQDYPYEDLVEELKVKRDSGRNPLFDVMFEYQTNLKETELKIPNLNLTIYNGVEEKILTVSKFDLLLSAVESDEKLLLKLEYSYDLFERKTIERFIKYYKKIVNSVIADANIKLSEIKLIDEEEEHQLLFDFNDTLVEYKDEFTIISLFEKQVKKTPFNIAIQCDEISFTYKELNDLSDKFACYLSNKKNVVCGDFVGVILDREHYLTPSILAVLKSGAAFIPIDPKLPVERINSIIKDSKLKTVITRSQYSTDLIKVDLFNLDQEIENVINYNSDSNSVNVSANEIAYVIYTSGSTGVPKGVMIDHKSLVNYIRWAASKYINDEKSTFPLFTSISFDLTITSIFSPIVTGNKLVIFPESETESIVENVFMNNDIDVIKLTPSHLKIIKESEFTFDQCNKKRLIVGGEDFEGKLAIDIHNKFNGEVIMYNEYGPTEATVGCMIHEFKPNEKQISVPIGKPINNTQIYILDKSLNPVPMGVEGELYISGEGLSKGYLQNEELTREKFIDNPFIKGAKMYKSGDLASLLSDGNIIYKGRIDDQIKIRGYRVELGEIESTLYTFPGIKKATVIVSKNGNDKQLVAYYVADKKLEVNELQEYLVSQLPDYMVPVNFIQLAQIPLTRNGKLDKKALPELDIAIDYVKPSCEIEEKLAETYAKVLKLNIDQVSVNKSFFELGGNSIRVILLISAIKKISAVKLTLKDVFDNPTIQQLALVIEKASDEKASIITRIGKSEFYPASPAQSRMFYQQGLDANDLGWNISTALEIKMDYDVEELKRTFQSLVDRHECLRTSFILSENGVVQKINENVNFELKIIEQQDYISKEDAFKDFVVPFDLSDQSLFRYALLKRVEECDILFIDVHHIVCDGRSLDIMIQDFTALYQGEELLPLEMRYIDYANWQLSESEKMEKQLQYWSHKLSGQLPRLELPTIQDRNAVGTYVADTSTLEINGELYQSIKKYTSDSKVSNFMFFLSLYYILLSKMSGKNDVIIGTDVLGRTQPAFKDIIGTFVNILPLRVKVDPNSSYMEFLLQVKSCVLDAFENQDFQFDQMVSLLNKEERTKRNPIVDVHFAVSDTVEGDEELKSLSLSPILINKHDRTSPYEFKIEVIDKNNQLDIVFIYSQALYSQEIIDVLKSYYLNILNSVLIDQSVEIEGIALANQQVDFSF
jgi:iturin family lipopeptide synthetase A